MPTASTSFLDELSWRGLLYQQTDGLAAHLAKAPVVAYCGFDPTAPSLHIGNLVPAMLLVHAARAGHRAIALVGGGTAMIGDPSGKSEERPLSSTGTIDANAARIHAQLERLFRSAGTTGVAMVNNADWLREMRMIDFMRDVGKHFPINYMLAKDSVQSRLETGISYTEFSYMLLQAFDFLQLYRSEGVTLQVGGTDQWGNITAGMELVRRAGGGEAHVLTAPLVTTSSGKKFGKSESNAVWLDPELTSPYQFYQFWVNTEDADVGRYLRMFTFRSQAEIAGIEAAHAAAPHERRAQRELARDVTSMLHGVDAARVALEVSRVIFEKKANPVAIDDYIYETLAAEIPGAEYPDATELNVLDLLEDAFSLSRSAGRKLVQQGGITVNGRKLTGDELTVPLENAVRGRWFLVRKGGRDIALAEIGGRRATAPRL
ncbi:MAG TPA: tyrosine--tRNA ligase [Gemmatimonadaceae bacterium]|nr:tyrosine--tRNA ligase [Gemmatimonadaceae bacterium]